MSTAPMPVEAVLQPLKEALREDGSAVLVAAPGAGKTTRVPLALLDEPWLAGQRILLLEPRRMAARAAAGYMAGMLGEKAGETVGYRIRMDSRVGPRTRIEVITEGILTRMLQSDPSLEGVGLVIFDEFHERSLHADLGLALCLESRHVLREDLRLLVMSATIEAEPVAALLGGAKAVVSEGRQYPVETRYAPRQAADERLEAYAARVVRQALAEETGGLLVFLPGEAEIRRTAAQLAGNVPLDVRVLPLYGALPQAEQDRALAEPEAGTRKVVLATAIAETSLTVAGVRVVVDAGLSRVPRFSPRTGMTRLATVTVSLASADQRRGRAGRLEPGVCYRLWTPEQERAMAPSGSPEMLEADLAPLLLELDAWGAGDPRELPFLDAPPEPALKQAAELLSLLGARGADGKLTDHGRRIAETGLHPRLAHMVLRAVPLGLGALACELAALLGERDILGPAAGGDADVTLRLAALRNAGSGHAAGAPAANESAVRRIIAEADHLKRSFGLERRLSDKRDDPMAGLLLGFAYPDRIAMKRQTGPAAGVSGSGTLAAHGGAYTLSNGRGAVLPRLQPLSNGAFLAAAELEDTGSDSRIRLAAAFDVTWLGDYYAEQIETVRAVRWDRQAGAVRARRIERFGALVLKESVLASPEPEEIGRALLEGLRHEGLDKLPWPKAAKQCRDRMAAMHRVDASWPDVSDEALLAGLEDWLLPHVIGMTSLGALQRLDMRGALEAMLDWNKRRELDAEMPTHYQVPSGSRIAIDYSDPAAPVLAVKLQEMFGLYKTPAVGRGRLPLTLHLLSPASRPVQVTRDLEGFWQNTYFDVKKDLKGRYPKHYWPDDPTAAVPTSRVRPRP